MENEKPNDLGKLLENTMAAADTSPEIQAILEEFDKAVVARVHAWISQEVTVEQVRAVMWAMAQLPEEAVAEIMKVSQESGDFNLEQSAEEDLEQYT